MRPGSRQLYYAARAYEELRPATDKATIAVFKMHGGLDWHIHKGGPGILKQTTPTYLGDDPDCFPIMIFPAQNKPGDTWFYRAIFRFAHEYLGMTLDRARLLIVSGYRFRDHRISARIASSLSFNTALRVVAYDPAPSDLEVHLQEELGTTKNVEVKEGTFEDQETREAMLQEIRRALAGKDE